MTVLLAVARHKRQGRHGRIISASSHLMIESRRNSLPIRLMNGRAPQREPDPVTGRNICGGRPSLLRALQAFHLCEPKMASIAVQSGLQLYLRSINESPLLTADEEKQLS